ncbi:MAG: DUF1801 domain-containing protein [Planctomycetes bacterium]|nr:DUF1801 domain-containing protein [Planctomycetota bacterium]
MAAKKAAKGTGRAPGEATPTTRKPAERNPSKSSTAERSTATKAPRPKRSSPSARRPGDSAGRLLSGDNPQTPKGYGDAPVQAYLAAIPGWKQDLGRRLDALIAGAVPEVCKAVKWNSPFYGIEGEGWFLSLHFFNHSIKVTFFRGTSLRPVPPGASKHAEVRYLDIREGELDEGQFVAWVRQARRLPGERM